MIGSERAPRLSLPACKRSHGHSYTYVRTRLKRMAGLVSGCSSVQMSKNIALPVHNPTSWYIDRPSQPDGSTSPRRRGQRRRISWSCTTWTRTVNSWNSPSWAAKSFLFSRDMMNSAGRYSWGERSIGYPVKASLRGL